jgi:hypothetical protein
MGNIFRDTTSPILKTIQLALPSTTPTSDHSTTSLNSQQPISQEFTRENPKSNNLPAKLFFNSYYVLVSVGNPNLSKNDIVLIFILIFFFSKRAF